MKRVVIESPLSGDFEKNIKYARLCCLDVLSRGEAPYASHLLMTQFLNDKDQKDRDLGMNAGFEWGKQAELVAVYIDNGISKGMERGIEIYKCAQIPVEFRKLPSQLSGDINSTEGIFSEKKENCYTTI